MLTCPYLKLTMQVIFLEEIFKKYSFGLGNLARNRKILMGIIYTN